MFDNVKYLDGFFQAPVLVLLGNDEVYVHVGVDKIPVGGPPHGALNAHQTVLLCPLEYGPRVEILRMTRIFYVGPYPTYIFAPRNKEIQSRHPISQRSTKLCSFVINLKKKDGYLNVCRKTLLILIIYQGYTIYTCFYTCETPISLDTPSPYPNPLNCRTTRTQNSFAQPPLPRPSS